LAAACNVTFPGVSLSAIRSVTERSTETVRLMVPDSLEKAFPKRVRKYGQRFCWTVGKACTNAMNDYECTADTSLYCSSQLARPTAIPIKTMHIHPSGAIAFKINLDCNYAALRDSNGGKLYRSVQESLKETIAFKADAGSGQDVSPSDIHLAPVEGELGVLEATIIPKDEASSSYILKQFGHSERVKQALIESLGDVKGINNVCPVADSVVSKISTPIVKVCPQPFCPPGDLKMRSHGKNSFCRAKAGSTRYTARLKQKKYFTLESCQEACLNDDNCHGIEYEYMLGVKNCELWMQPIHFCSVVSAPSDEHDMKSFFECYSKCERRNAPVVLPTSFPQPEVMESVATEAS